MALKDKLINNIVAPVANSHSATFITASVLAINERNNVCNISYINQEGVKVYNNNVPIKLNNINFIDWFPKVNDTVIISVKRDEIFIVGPNYQQSYKEIRDQIQLSNDIYSDNSSYFLGGYIF